MALPTSVLTGCQDGGARSSGNSLRLVLLNSFFLGAGTVSARLTDSLNVLLAEFVTDSLNVLLAEFVGCVKQGVDCGHVFVVTTQSFCAFDGADTSSVLRIRHCEHVFVVQPQPTDTLFGLQPLSLICSQCRLRAFAQQPSERLCSSLQLNAA